MGHASASTCKMSNICLTTVELTFEMQRGDLCHYLVSHLKGNLYTKELAFKMKGRGREMMEE